MHQESEVAILQSQAGDGQILADSLVSAVDLFCGAGGLSYGLMQAGIAVEAGIDIDPHAEYAFSQNHPGAQFLLWDLTQTSPKSIEELFRSGKIRLLAGCAPCKPFSQIISHIKKAHKDRNLLDCFGHIVEEILPELVAMENVPGLATRGAEVFGRFLDVLKRGGYYIDWQIINCRDYGVPQSRRRLVLLASRLGEIKIPAGRYSSPDRWITVRQAIGHLRPLQAGEADPDDPLHVARRITPLNLRRMRATPPDGGSRTVWPEELRLKGRYKDAYGRMWWDKPAPTITTWLTGLGSGRSGHPEQDRSITPREGAIFQSFPCSFIFWPPDKKLNTTAVCKLIGNAVPPKLGEALGEAIMSHVKQFVMKP